MGKPAPQQGRTNLLISSVIGKDHSHLRRKINSSWSSCGRIMTYQKTLNAPELSNLFTENHLQLSHNVFTDGCYRFALADKYANEKIINRPALATALTLLTGLNDNELTQWLHRTDKEILSLMGFPVTARNIFKRLVPLALTKKRLHQLNSLLLNCPSTFKRMYHIGRINDGVLAILFNPPLDKIVSIELLNEVGINHKDDRRPRTIKQLSHAVTLYQSLGKSRPVVLIKSTKNFMRCSRNLKRD